MGRNRWRAELENRERCQCCGRLSKLGDPSWQCDVDLPEGGMQGVFCPGCKAAALAWIRGEWSEAAAEVH